MLLLAPIAPGFWLISLAERSEEHHDVVQVEELSGRIARGRLVQPPPPPSRRAPLSAASRRRHDHERQPAARHRRTHQRRRRGQRVPRRVFYGDDDPDPDSHGS